jgi:hypothetical protein
MLYAKPGRFEPALQVRAIQVEVDLRHRLDHPGETVEDAHRDVGDAEANWRDLNRHSATLPMGRVLSAGSIESRMERTMSVDECTEDRAAAPRPKPRRSRELPAPRLARRWRPRTSSYQLNYLDSMRIFSVPARDQDPLRFR